MYLPHVKAVMFDVSISLCLMRSAILTGIMPDRLPSLHMWFPQIGGVVLRSPFIAIADYEAEKKLPPHYLNVSMWVQPPVPPTLH